MITQLTRQPLLPFMQTETRMTAIYTKSFLVNWPSRILSRCLLTSIVNFWTLKITFTSRALPSRSQPWHPCTDGDYFETDGSRSLILSRSLLTSTVRFLLTNTVNLWTFKNYIHVESTMIKTTISTLSFEKNMMKIGNILWKKRPTSKWPW